MPIFDSKNKSLCIDAILAYSINLVIILSTVLVSHIPEELYFFRILIVLVDTFLIIFGQYPLLWNMCVKLYYLNFSCVKDNVNSSEC